MALIYTPGHNIVYVADDTGESYSADASHANFDRIVEAAKNKEWDLLPNLFNVAKAVVAYGKGLITVVDDEVLCDGVALHNSLTERMLAMMNEGFDIDPLVKFLENLLSNPSMRAVNELYDFLEVGKLPITEDGHFLAYKKVGPNYMDIYSGKFDNSIGAVCEMQRNQVDEDKDRTCSYGLHFCSKDYLSHYGSTSGDRVMIVKINPADVVAIPADYNNTKGRCCRYLVIGEVPNGQRVDAFHQSVYDTTDFGYDPDEEDLDDEGCPECGDDLNDDACDCSVNQSAAEFEVGYRAGHPDGKGHKVKQKFATNSPRSHGYDAGYKDGRAKRPAKY